MKQNFPYVKKKKFLMTQATLRWNGEIRSSFLKSNKWNWRCHLIVEGKAQLKYRSLWKHYRGHTTWLQITKREHRVKIFKLLIFSFLVSSENPAYSILGTNAIEHPVSPFNFNELHQIFQQGLPAHLLQRLWVRYT